MNRTFVTQVAGRIESFLEEFTGQKGVFLIEAIVRGPRTALVIEVFVDGDVGIDAGTCAEISRALKKELEATVMTTGDNYELTVSSPGLDRPLKFPRQYGKHVGRGILVKIRAGGSTQQLRGILTAAGERSITVQGETAGTDREIPFDEIAEARIEPRW